VETLPRRGPSELAAYVSFALEQEVAEEQRFWYRLPVTPYNVMVLSGYRSEIYGAFGMHGFHTSEQRRRHLR